MKSILTTFLADHSKSLSFVLASGIILLPNFIPQPTLAADQLGEINATLTTRSSFTQTSQTSRQPIPFDTKYQDDGNLEIGAEVISQTGVDGVLEVETIVIYHDGQIFETQIDQNILTPPTDEIIIRGTKIVPKTFQSADGPVTYIQKLDNFWATSYDSTCLGCSTITATGMKQGTGVVAVDPTVIPLHSQLYIPGYGYAVAGDVGGAVKGNKIDLGYDSLMGQWSARYVDVYLISTP